MTQTSSTSEEMEDRFHELSRKDAEICHDARHAAHCMIYARTPKAGLNKNELLRAHILMLIRHDGSIGFPGGFVDKDESWIDCCIREVKEELAHDLSKESMTYIYSFLDKKSKYCLHFYTCEVSEKEFELMERNVFSAHHFGTETLGITRVPLYTTRGKKRGFPVFLGHRFIGNSRDELLIGLVKTGVLTKEECDHALELSATPHL